MNYEVVKNLATLSENKNSSKQINLVSWNQGKPKLDLRRWREVEDQGTVPCKGIALTDEEAKKLFTVLGKYLDEV